VRAWPRRVRNRVLAPVVGGAARPPRSCHPSPRWRMGFLRRSWNALPASRPGGPESLCRGRLRRALM